MPGLARADVLIMLRAVAMLALDAITIPMTPQGKPTMRLGPVCRANGIVFDEADAHDALNDVHATIALFRLLRERAPAASPGEEVLARLARAHPRQIKRIVQLALGYAAGAGRCQLTVADVEAAERLAMGTAKRDPIGFLQARG